MPIFGQKMLHNTLIPDEPQSAWEREMWPRIDFTKAAYMGVKSHSYHDQKQVRTFVREVTPIIVGINETIERRWGAKIVAKGI